MPGPRFFTGTWEICWQGGRVKGEKDGSAEKEASSHLHNRGAEVAGKEVQVAVKAVGQ